MIRLPPRFTRTDTLFPYATLFRSGFGVRSHNLGIDYLNSFSDRPFLSKRVVPEDPAMSVVHRSDQHSWIYTERGYRDGVRNRHDDLAPRSACRNDVQACAEKEPFDPAMEAQLERRGVPIGPVPGEYGKRRIRSSESDAPEMTEQNQVAGRSRSEEHTAELQSLIRNSSDVIL